MKKALIVFATGGLLLAGWIICRLTNVLNFYKIPTISNMPTYKDGDVLAISRFKKAGRNTFICYKQAKQEYPYISRCVAIEGDIIEMKDAVLYLNGKKLNEPFTWNQYYINANQLSSIEGYIKTYRYYVEPVQDTLSMIMMGAADVKKYRLNLRQVIHPKGEGDPEAFKFAGNTTYNADNFGPIKVPQGSYFLLGDNRHDSYDSRYKGFINKDEILGVVIGKVYYPY